tara:strand:- start:58 stop:384 length:327 start_codon:yes stop_codon:yes gene_type:complete
MYNSRDKLGITRNRLINESFVCHIMAKKNQTTTSNEETIGFHKGSLATLTKEREEFIRMLQIVEQLMQMHIKELKNLGVDLEQQARKAVAGSNGTKKLKGKKDIEDIL